jgi:hypothetical protein
MQFLWLTIAGACLAWAYLSILGTVLFGPTGRRMSLLLAIVGFLEGTAIVLCVLYVLSQGSLERLLASLAGFVAARAVLGRRLFGAQSPADAVSAAPSLGQQPLDRLA